MLCRLCLIDSLQVFKLFDGDGERLKIAEIIGQHFWFIPKKDDQMSDKICCTCWLKVESFHQFYCFVQDAHKKLSEIALIKQDASQSIYANANTNPNRHSFKTEEDDNEEWMNDIPDEYVDGIVKDAISDDIKYKTEKQSKTTNDDYDSKHDNNEMEYPEDTNTNQSNEIDMKIKSTASNDGSTLCTDAEKTSSKSDGIGRKKRSPKEKSSNNSDSENDSDSTGFVHHKSKKEKNEELEWCKISKDDEKISKFMKLKCDLCSDEFTIFAQIKQHFRKVHDRNGYVVCCNKRLYKKIYLLEHINKHIDPEYFKCDECNKTFSDKQCLRYHMVRHELDESKVFKCDQCPRKYATQYLLKRHKYSHIPPEERQFKCDDCGSTFSTKNLLQAHYRCVHQNAYGKMCHICAKVIRGVTMFEKHQKEHAGIVESKVQCKKCGAWLKQVSLRAHMNRHMESLTIYKCDICEKIASTRMALKNHLKYVHEAKRVCQCNICDKAFKKALELKEHMATHTGEVLYTCPHCPKTFYASANMYSHRKNVHRKEWEESRRNRGLPSNKIKSNLRSRNKNIHFNDDAIIKGEDNKMTTVPINEPYKIDKS